MLIPLQRLLVEATERLSLSEAIRSSIIARAFEDNQGAFYLATNQRITHCTRWYCNRWHWFWQYFNDGTVKILEVETALQDADYFTKALTFETFEENRMRVQKW